MVTFPLVLEVLFFLSDPSPFQPGYENRERAFEDPASAFQKLKIIKPRKSLVSVGGCVCVLGVELRASALDASILPQSLASSLRHTSH